MILDSGSGAVRFLFAHGAGAPMDSPFMNEVAAALAGQGIRVIRFEFPYMAARRAGARKPPDREAVLLDTWRTIIAAHRGEGPVFIGGKSMGGRMATMIADEVDVEGVICFGYPFHPPGKPDKLRIAHLRDIRTPVLMLQGTRDALGFREEIEPMELSKAVRIEWIEDGDHSLKPRVKSGRTLEANLDQASKAAADFILS
ncbi:MAG: alpha/beta fold hydrolase [Thermoanaerobaculia bacterium]